VIKSDLLFAIAQGTLLW